MLLEEYINEMQANRKAPNTIRNHLFILKKLNDFKKLVTITEKDLKEFFNCLVCSDQNYALHQAIIKQYFRKIGQSEMVEWIKIIKPKETLKSDDILTTEDINKLIEATESHYYKALISFLYESGCRISEAQTIKVHEFIETTDGMIVHIPSKKTPAGYRKVLLPFSAQYIRNLKMYSNKKDDEVLFSVKHWQTNKMLKDISRKAGIKKPVSPHKFRHAQATAMVQLNYNEMIIRKKLGWTPTSGMIARYQHLSDDDVINATIQNQGKLPVKAIRTELKEASKLTLVDAAQQFSKLAEENEILKSEMEKIKAFLDEDTIKALIDARVNKLMK